MAITYKAIATTTVGSGGASSIDFTSIPATYTDLLLVISTRQPGGAPSWSDLRIRFNSSTTSYTDKLLYGDGSSATSISESDTGIVIRSVNNGVATANTFGSASIYIPNYTSSNYKSVSIDQVTENNATQALAGLTAGLWSNTSAITSIGLTPNTAGNFSQYSTATLYGIKNS
jgi:hypothetical protein